VIKLGSSYLRSKLGRDALRPRCTVATPQWLWRASRSRTYPYMDRHGLNPHGPDSTPNPRRRAKRIPREVPAEPKGQGLAWLGSDSPVSVVDVLFTSFRRMSFVHWAKRCLALQIRVSSIDPSIGRVIVPIMCESWSINR